MCGRFVQKTPLGEIRVLFGASNPVPNAPPRYNAAPTDTLAVVRYNPKTSERSLDLLRWGPMAVADFVAEFFDTELLRAVIAARGIFGTALGPWSAGSTAVLLLRAVADSHPVGSAAFPLGGLGDFTRALAEAAMEDRKREGYF